MGYSYSGSVLSNAFNSVKINSLHLTCHHPDSGYNRS